MKNALPLIIYLVVVAGGMIMLSQYREKQRLADITYSKNIIGDYYFYMKTPKLSYISTKVKQNKWGEEVIKPTIYEFALYNDFILAKTHPIQQDFSNQIKENGLMNSMVKEMKIDSIRSVYAIYNVKTQTTTTANEWALFEKDLTTNLIPLNIQFTLVKDLK